MAAGPDPTNETLVAVDTADGGRTWSDQSIPGAPSIGWGGIECRSATNCLAVAPLVSQHLLMGGGAVVLSY